ncbi:MAG: phosphate signaling complex protein PhoU [Thermodesulfovibrionales bacterium]|jgi:phosphate transport system protein|nr:phosphate signaling complex protein PhoU [Thermodesulfovibrionales bacterium]
MTRFDEELMHLKEMVLRMGAMVESSIKDSVKSLVERNDDLAKAVIERDHQINALDVHIDEECIRLIALMQPMAGDLRFLTTAMKITTDLERMGDNAVNIAERALELNREPILKPYIDIPHMSQIAQGMTRDALDAFVRRDKKLAMDVIMRDDEVDDLKYGILEELISFMIRDPNTVYRAMKISFIAQYLERIADHATNIAEMVVYLVAGKIIRHMTLPTE